MKTVTTTATQKRQNVSDPGSIQKAIFSLCYFLLINKYSTTSFMPATVPGVEDRRGEGARQDPQLSGLALQVGKTD